MRRRLFFWWRYQRGQAGWDSGITPPEVVSYVASGVTPGWALDVGCGTGTNVVYLAQQGWHADGVDFIVQPIRTARRKARAAQVQGQTRFWVGDVTRLERYPLHAAYELVLDIGCSHGLSMAGRARYVAGLAARMRPGGVVLMYALAPREGRGIDEAGVRAAFEGPFTLEAVQHGADTVAHSDSAWYTLRRQ